MKDNKAQRSKAAQWVSFCLLGLWGSVSFIVLAGEENPRGHMRFSEFLLIKAIAMISLLLCCYVGKKLRKAGYFPIETDDEE